MTELKFKKHIPNILTNIRLILIPVFLYCLISDFNNSYLFALIIFVVASITDYYDGKLAREYGVESKYGVFMDPLADKLLVISAFIGFLSIEILSDIVHLWMVVIIFLRDFFVTMLRIFMKKRGLNMLTSKIAKLKTAAQLITIIFILLLLSFNQLNPLLENHFFISLIILIMLFFTVITGIDYYIKNYKTILLDK